MPRFATTFTLTMTCIVTTTSNTSPVHAQEPNCYLVESAHLPSDGRYRPHYGFSLAYEGDFALVGAPDKNDRGTSSGAAFLLHFDGARWVEQEIFYASDAEDYDRFGTKVALSGNTIMISAHGDDDGAPDAGAVYIFQYNGAQWVEKSKIMASDPIPSGRFGDAIELAGDMAIIAAPAQNGIQPVAGAAYVFKYDGTQWKEDQKLIASDGASEDQFGVSATLSGNTAIIGSFYDDDHGESSGSAYVFNYDGSKWNETAKFNPADGSAGDMFGRESDLDGDVAVIGAKGHDELGLNAGAAYIFRFDGAQWREEAKLQAFDAAPHDWFGSDVAIQGNAVVLGALNDDNSADDAGAAYIFRYQGNEWITEAKLMQFRGFKGAQFGHAIVIHNQYALIGAPGASDAFFFKLKCGCLDLKVEKFISGNRASFTISNGTPNAKAVTVYSTKLGQTPVNNYHGYCVTFGIQTTEDRVIGPVNRVFDANGQINFRINVPDNLSGQPFYFQSAQQHTCPDECTSNVIEATVQ